MPQCDYVTDIRTLNAETLKIFAFIKSPESVVNSTDVCNYSLLSADSWSQELPYLAGHAHLSGCKFNS